MGQQRTSEQLLCSVCGSVDKLISYGENEMAFGWRAGLISHRGVRAGGGQAAGLVFSWSVGVCPVAVVLLSG